MNKYNHSEHKHCICYVGSYNTSKEYIKISDIYPLKEGTFEKHKFNIPGNYDVYLTNLYGDYMKLPPKNKRKNHNPVEIKFNEGKNIINKFED
jgi:lipopolysaccharide cholinephosphotransferase